VRARRLGADFTAGSVERVFIRRIGHGTLPVSVEGAAIEIGGRDCGW